MDGSPADKDVLPALTYAIPGGVRSADRSGSIKKAKIDFNLSNYTSLCQKYGDCITVSILSSDDDGMSIINIYQPDGFTSYTLDMDDFAKESQTILHKSLNKIKRKYS